MLIALACVSGVNGLLLMYYAVIAKHATATRAAYLALSFVLMGFAAIVLLPFTIAG